MIPKSKIMLDRSISAMTAAIEIYNKPNFQYREETFSILAINSWELLFKAKYLANNSNKISSLYKRQNKYNQDGSKSKVQTVQKTRSGNPYTHGLEHLGKHFIETAELNITAWDNIQAMLEIRDTAVHFYNYNNHLTTRLQEIGAATVKNFAIISKRWFGYDFSDSNLYLIPISIVRVPDSNIVVLNSEEQNLISFLESKADSHNTDENSDYSFAVGIEVHFVKSKDKTAFGVRVTNDPNAPEFRLTEQQILEKFPLNYSALIERCKTRYDDFKQTAVFYRHLNAIKSNPRLSYRRNLYQERENGPKTHYYSEASLSYLDNHYTKTNK